VETTEHVESFGTGELLRESLKGNVNEGESLGDIAKSFDIKKAVIFSEILNTKYF
jgi:hypothetical protein